jgi:hypothetical protein
MPAAAIALSVQFARGLIAMKFILNSVAFNSQRNYTDCATATCWRNLVPTFADRGVSRGQRGGSPRLEFVLLLFNNSYNNNNNNNNNNALSAFHVDLSLRTTDSKTAHM